MIRWFSAFGLCCLLFWLGCSSSGDTIESSGNGSTNAAASMPPGFEMMLGEGGGFAGYWSGYTIHGDGTVYAWRGPVAGAGLDSVGALHTDSLLALWQTLHQIGFWSDFLNEKGNLTAFVSVTADTLQNRVTWIPGVESLQAPQHPVEALYRRTRSMANALSK